MAIVYHQPEDAPKEKNPLFPVSNPTTPYWRSELHRLDSYRSTPELPAACDILIIGAGMAGVSVAYHFAKECSTEPPSTVLLDARQLCSGATGRNGGHIKVKKATHLRWRESVGPSDAEAISAFAKAHIYAIKDVVEKESLDCEFELRRSYDVFVKEKDADTIHDGWVHSLNLGEAWTRETDVVGDKFAETVSAVKGAKLAVSSPACSLWPYKFVSQLLERTMEANPQLNVQMETPVTDVEFVNGDGVEGETNIVHTSRGSIKARKVIFASNAYTAGLLPQYKAVITPYKGTAARLGPPPGRDAVFPHLSHTYNIEYGLRDDSDTVDYLNPRPDGGIVLGGGSWLFKDKRELWYGSVDDSTLFDSIQDEKYFEDYMQRNFRGWEDSGTEVDKIWTGSKQAVTHHLPHIFGSRW
jgi:glycine/D-amino acid oxidase-like deaminating enzyme